MRRTTTTSVCAALLVAIAHPHARANAQDRAPTVTRLAEGVYAMTRPNVPDRFGDSNNLVIINDSDVVVVDANLTAGSARLVIAEIRKLTTKPVRYVITTHWHDDHHIGNEAFAAAYPGVDFIAHANTRTDVDSQVIATNAQTVAGMQAQLKQYEGVLAAGKRSNGAPLTDADRARFTQLVADLRSTVGQREHAHFILPTITFTDSLVLYRGARRIELRFLGRGNTRGDIVVYLPRERVLATGDLVVSPIPYSYGSYLGDWIQTLGALQRFDATQIMPGHGDVMHDMNYVGMVRELLGAILTQMKGAVAKGMDLEAARKAIDLTALRARFTGGDKLLESAFDAFLFQPATERAFLEASGKPL